MIFKLISVAMVLSMTACLFSNDNEGKLVKISNSYSFLVHPSGNQLMYKKNEKMNGSEILEKNFDSIGWNENYIIIFSEGEYKCYSQLKSLPIINSSRERERIFDNDLFKNIILHSFEYFKSSK